jgi:NADH-quinone oxidoreductase subunit C
MPEDTKANPAGPPPEEKPAEKPAEASATSPAAKAAPPTALTAKPPAPAAPAKTAPAAPPKPATPGTPAAKPAAPAKPTGPVPEPWLDPLPNTLKSHFGSAVKEASTYIGQKYLVVERAVATDVLQFLRDAEQFDYCVDLTAVHYPKRELQFDMLWILYSFARNERIRVKTQIKEGEAAPSVVSLWPTANWLERECYDMFGITFEGHPDLRRILLPDGWKGFPLRKDYSILLQDKEWVQANLGIESGQ